MRRFTKAAAALVTLACLAVPWGACAQEMVRVMVMDDLKMLTLHMPEGYEARGGMGALGPDARTVVMDGENGPPAGVRLHAGGAVININQFALTGVIEVRKNERGLYRIINEIGLEEYTAAVVGEEIPPSWPLEALKAQAVVARTYALYRKSKSACADYDLCSTVSSQVFTGDALKEPGPAYAVKETEGLVLSYNGALAETPYHSSCGGSTEDADAVWSWPLPYLKGVGCPCGKQSPYALWQRFVTAQELAGALAEKGYKTSGKVSVSVEKRSARGRAKEVRIGSSGGVFFIKGDELRRVLGYGRIPSTDFRVDKVSDGFMFKGKGSGHGVGLCQWGSKVMAEEGRSYTEILAHYYPGAALARLDGKGAH